MKKGMSYSYEMAPQACWITTRLL